MSALAAFDVTVTFCFTPGSSGLRDDHTSPPRRIRLAPPFSVSHTGLVIGIAWKLARTVPSSRLASVVVSVSSNVNRRLLGT